MKSLKRFLPIILIFLLVASVIYFVNTRIENVHIYTDDLNEARHLAENGAYAESVKEYAKALETYRSLPVLVEAGEVLLKAGDYQGALTWYEDTLLEEHPRSAETYYYGMRVYEKKKQFDNFFSVYDIYVKRGLSSSEVDDLERQYHYLYELLGSFDEVGIFNPTSKLAPVRYGDKWGAVNRKGSSAIYYKYNQIGSISSMGPAMTTDGRAICIDAQGNEKLNENFILEKDPDFGSVKAFQTVYSGLLPAWNGITWNYYDAETLEKRFGGFKEALPIANQIGAVSEDGIKWAVISSDGNLLSDASFDEILTDERGICCKEGRLIVRQGTSYYLIDTTGKQVTGIGYTEAHAFNDTGMAAVKKNGQWIFIDLQGNETSLGSFEEAKSFSNGYAAVKKDGRWGYIDVEGNMVIKNEFFDAGPFSSSSVAFVQMKDGTWELLSLISANH